jgi:hypothetical protein
MPATATRSFTTRLHTDVYEAASALAKQRKVSLNSLVEENLAKVIWDAEDREMYEAYDLRGQYSDDSSVEYAFAAQAEVALEVVYDPR